MRTIRTVIGHDWLLLTRNRSLWLLTGILVLTWAYALYYGQAVMSKQHDTLTQLETLDNSTKTAFRSLFQRTHRPDTIRADGNLLTSPLATESYLVNNVAVNTPSAWAALVIGQRDVWPQYRKVSGRSLFFDGNGVVLEEAYGEIMNPQRLVAGNFDWAFVLVYLLPLLIIALGYNVLSQESELGTLPLLAMLPLPVWHLVAWRLLFRWSLVMGLVSVLTIVGLYLVGGSPIRETGTVIGWVGYLTLYTGFWFGLCFWVAARRGTSAMNALALLAVWVAALFIIPALVNAYTTLRYPVTNRVTLLDGLRETTDGLWAQPSPLTFGPFFAEFPQYKKTVPDLFTDADMQRMATNPALRQFYAEKFFVWHHALSRLVSGRYDAYAAGRVARYRAGDLWRWVNPAVTMQEALSELAGSGYRQHEAFQRAVSQYHRQVMNYSNGLTFSAKPLTLADYIRYPAFALPPPSGDDTASAARPLLVLSALVWLIGWLSWRRQTNRPV